jgi:hypothetical protein
MFGREWRCVHGARLGTAFDEFEKVMSCFTGQGGTYQYVAKTRLN